MWRIEGKRSVYTCTHIHCANLIVRHEKDTTIKPSARGRERLIECERAVRDRIEIENGRGELAGTRWMWKVYNGHSLNDGNVTSTTQNELKSSRTSVCICSACEYLDLCVCVPCAHNKNGLAARKTEQIKRMEQNSTTKRNKRKTVNLCGY